MTHRKTLDDALPKWVAELVDNINALPTIKRVGDVFLPSRERIVEAIDCLRQLMFPGFIGRQGLTPQNLPFRIGELVLELNDILFEQVSCCVRYRKGIVAPSAEEGECADCEDKAAAIVGSFLSRLPAIREMLAADVQAAFDSDPAAQTPDETIFCYPGLEAITIQRLAHEFFKLDVPLLPRIMTEYAHSLTGIDIHPGAKLGRSIFIDHGTGVVIGETVVIGDNVKIYQGVTLGALAPAFGQALRGQKRHPTIEDGVVIYAGATILGGDTIIGSRSVIGGNVFITSSVPPQNQVVADPPNLRYRDRRPKSQRGDVVDFQI